MALPFFLSGHTKHCLYRPLRWCAGVSDDFSRTDCLTAGSSDPLPETSLKNNVCSNIHSPGPPAANLTPDFLKLPPEVSPLLMCYFLHIQSTHNLSQMSHFIPFLCSLFRISPNHINADLFWGHTNLTK